MHILMTGATGFIGSHLIPLLSTDHKLVLLGRRAPASSESSMAHWVEHDFHDFLDFDKLPPEIDAVIHLAQCRHYKQFPDRAQDIFDINVRSTLALLEYARVAKAHSFLYASSGGVYATSYERLVEGDLVRPLSFYHTSKYISELLIGNYESFFRTIIFRFFFVYGPGQSGMLIPNLLQKILNGETIAIDGMPGRRLNPIHVADAIRVFPAALHNPAVRGLFNVAGNQVPTVTGLVDLLAEVCNRRAIITYTDTYPEGDLIGDNSRMQDVLGVHPQISLRDGLRSMLS
jgi:nucleoside-diphosphate-sugar epimerase